MSAWKRSHSGAISRLSGAQSDCSQPAYHEQDFVRISNRVDPAAILDLSRVDAHRTWIAPASLRHRPWRGFSANIFKRLNNPAHLVLTRSIAQLIR